MRILDINNKKHTGASSGTFWEGCYPSETKGDGATWPRAYGHSWIMHRESSSHSSSLLLHRNHIKLSYVSQRLALRHMDYLSCYTVRRTCEIYKWKRRLHMFFTSFLYPKACWLSKYLHQEGCTIYSLVTKSFSHLMLQKLSCPFSSLSRNRSWSQSNLGSSLIRPTASLWGIPSTPPKLLRILLLTPSILDKRKMW